MQVTFNLSEFERKAIQLGATEKQIPYALATGMTWAMRDAVDAETQAIPQAFDRPVPFTMMAIGYTPASKNSLRFEVFVKDRQATYLGIGVQGGTRTPASAKTLATPFIQRNAYGNVGRGALRAIAQDPKVFSGVPRGGGGKPAGLWRRTGNNTSIRLLALFKPTLEYSKRFDFDGIFERTVRAQMPTKIARAVERVMTRFAARGG